MHRFAFLVGAAVLAACGGSTPAAPDAPDTLIAFVQTASGWTADPVEDELDRVSHNDTGYTGEIDRFAITAPAAGRLQVSLSWEHEADFDLFLTSDPQGKLRLAEGASDDFDPEYVGLEVAAGQTLYIIVAGWDGDPGEYMIETILLPPGAPVFALEAAPDPERRHAANLPLVFSFNVELDLAQEIGERLYFVGPGFFAQGTWCIEGRDLIFYPRLPIGAGWKDLLAGDTAYIIQFPRGARGPRAATGEYLSTLEGRTLEMGGFADYTPGEPPRVKSVDHVLSEPWTGDPIAVTIEGAIDPASLEARLFHVRSDGMEIPIPFLLRFQQSYACLSGRLEARLVVEPTVPLPPSATVRLGIPGTVLELGSGLGLTGPFPAPAGDGYSVDFTTG